MLKDVLKNRRVLGGLACLVLLISGCLLYLKHVERENRIAEERTAEIARQANEQHRKTTSETEAVPPAQTGHFHADGTFHAEPHETPVAPPATAESDTPTPADRASQTGKLTYHAELLASNPVEALRAQAEERGYWNARWIPPFPPDDHEAQTFARNSYLTRYHAEGTPEFERAVTAYMEQSEEIRAKYPYNARRCDLMKITWTWLPYKAEHYDPKTGYAKYPSDYFPNHISDLK